jgi:hypothetical protein
MAKKKMTPEEELKASYKDFERSCKIEGKPILDMVENFAGVDQDFDTPGRPYEPRFTSEQDWRDTWR